MKIFLACSACSNHKICRVLHIHTHGSKQPDNKNATTTCVWNVYMPVHAFKKHTPVVHMTVCALLYTYGKIYEQVCECNPVMAFISIMTK